MSVFLYYFGWPDGAVWSNLLASVICAGVVWWRLRARMIAQHVEQLAQAERHHRDMKAHVATVSVSVPQQLLDDIRKRARGGGR
jgi:hypothetical protein